MCTELTEVFAFLLDLGRCWFAGDTEEVSTRIESDGTKPSRLFRAQMYTRIGVDSFLEKGKNHTETGSRSAMRV